jgi:hypothetical protein
MLMVVRLRSLGLLDFGFPRRCNSASIGDVHHRGKHDRKRQESDGHEHVAHPEWGVH